MALGSFVTSTMGMQAQSHALDQISSNVANVNTVGYKKVDARFETQMSKFNEIGTDTHSFTAGNVDRRMVDIAGILNTTNSVYDLGISGRGFFVVEGQNETMYTRAGNFQSTAVPPKGYPAQNVTFYKPDETSSNGVTTQTKPASYFTNSSGYYVMGWNYDTNREAFSSSLEPVIISPGDYYPGHKTTEMALKGNIPSSSKDPQLVKVPVYDDNYNQHNMTLKWTKGGDNANSWKVEIDVDGGAVTSGPIEVEFDSDAQIVSPIPSTNLTINWENGGSSAIKLDLSNMTQYATNFNASVLKQDGCGFGTFVSMAWDENGALNASYSNGARVPVCKVAVAQVQVPNMMEAVSGNMFSYNNLAGNLEILDLQNTKTETAVKGGTLEGSNVALEEEFSNMVVTQRAYSSSVNAFTTSNEMMQEAISILT